MPTEEEFIPEVSCYKNIPLLILNPGHRFIFSIGLSRCKLILAHLDAIRVFVETNGERCSELPKEI